MKAFKVLFVVLALFLSIASLSLLMLADGAADHVLKDLDGKTGSIPILANAVLPFASVNGDHLGQLACLLHWLILIAALVRRWEPMIFVIGQLIVFFAGFGFAIVTVGCALMPYMLL